MRTILDCIEECEGIKADPFILFLQSRVAYFENRRRAERGSLNYEKFSMAILGYSNALEAYKFVNSIKNQELEKTENKREDENEKENAGVGETPTQKSNKTGPSNKKDKRK